MKYNLILYQTLDSDTKEYLYCIVPDQKLIFQLKRSKTYPPILLSLKSARKFLRIEKRTYYTTDNQNILTIIPHNQE